MPIELQIVTPHGEAYRSEVDGVVLPGADGQFGVLPQHERFLTPLDVGEVQLQVGGQTLFAATSAGFADVSAEQVAVLVESCELAADIDVARAEHARERAEQGLASLSDPDDERYADFTAALERARNRLSVSQRR